MNYLTEGSYGKIYKKDDNVIKIFKKSHGDTLGNLHLIEYDITCRLNHPNIIKSCGLDPDGNLIFPYYNYDIWDNEILRLNHSSKINLIKQLIFAVDALHNYGFLHLDIKGNNIFIDKTLTKLVLADFGSSVYVGTKKSIVLERQLISHLYRPPENFINENLKIKNMTYNRASDYWSIGIVILEFLASRVRIFENSISRKLEFLKGLEMLFCGDKITELTIKHYIPNIDIEWLNNLKMLLSWNSEKRKLPFVNINKPEINIKRNIKLSLEEKSFLKKEFEKIKENIYSYPFESIILSIEIFKRIKENFKFNSLLFLSIVWMSIKFTSGELVDVRDISSQLDPVENIDDIIKVVDYEKEILQKLNGVIYTPNSWNNASNLEELKNSWYSIWSSDDDIQKNSYSDYIWSKDIKIGQFFNMLYN